jgi:putative chitinase
MTAQAPSPTIAVAPPVTLDQLQAIMPGMSAANGHRYIQPLNRAMLEFQITTPLRKAAFLAQIAVESGELRWFEELASGQAYDISENPRKARELGNLRPGDGRRYKGRGPIQLTGRANYREAGRELGLDLEGNPTRAASPDVGFRIAGWYWKKRRLNGLADRRNFSELTRRINAARKHYERRLAFYRRALGVLGAPTS